MYYIISGTMSETFIHESGNVEPSSFYGKGYLVSLYFSGEIEMTRSFTFTAVTDLEVYVFNRYINTNPALNIAMYRTYIKLVSLDGQEFANQLFSIGMEKICKFFYIY